MARYDDDDDERVDDDEAISEKPIRKKRRRGGNTFVDFLLFRQMVAPTILLVFFYLGLVACIIGGLFVIIATVINMTKGLGGWPAVLGILTGFAIMILYPIGLRVYAEVGIVLFRAYYTLVEIRDRL